MKCEGCNKDIPNGHYHISVYEFVEQRSGAASSAGLIPFCSWYCVAAIAGELNAEDERDHEEHDGSR